MRMKVLIGFGAVCVLAAPACIRRNHDYRFSVTGLVIDEKGNMLADADVVLNVYGPVYSGISSVRTERQRTNNTGGFVFMYISHQQGVKYVLTVTKRGFEPQTLMGNAPPDQSHKIRLATATSLHTIS
jgi:hypothetical protein